MSGHAYGARSIVVDAGLALDASQLLDLLNIAGGHKTRARVDRVTRQCAIAVVQVQNNNRQVTLQELLLVNGVVNGTV